MLKPKKVIAPIEQGKFYRLPAGYGSTEYWEAYCYRVANNISCAAGEKEYSFVLCCQERCSTQKLKVHLKPGATAEVMENLHFFTLSELEEIMPDKSKIEIMSFAQRIGQDETSYCLFVKYRNKIMKIVLPCDGRSLAYTNRLIFVNFLNEEQYAKIIHDKVLRFTHYTEINDEAVITHINRLNVETRIDFDKDRELYYHVHGIKFFCPNTGFWLELLDFDKDTCRLRRGFVMEFPWKRTFGETTT